MVILEIPNVQFGSVFILYSGLFSLGANFPEWWALGLAEIFPIKKFRSPTIEKSHMSNILYNTYMGKITICCTLAMSTVIIVLYSCMVTTWTCICTGVFKNSRFSAIYAHKESSLLWPDPFLAQGVYRLQYKHPAKALSMVIMLRSYLYVLNYLAGLTHNCM